MNSFKKAINTSVLLTIAGLAAVVLIGWTVLPSGSSFEDDLAFGTVKEQTMKFIEYQRTIQLSADQEAIKREALEAIPAPCCSDNNAYTCCCPCNLSLSVWGMAAYLITEKNADAETVRSKAQEWFKFVNPKGFSGDVCYTGGCGRPFAKNGCGGMNPARLAV